MRGGAKTKDRNLFYLKRSSALHKKLEKKKGALLQENQIINDKKREADVKEKARVQFEKMIRAVQALLASIATSPSLKTAEGLDEYLKMQLKEEEADYVFSLISKRLYKHARWTNLPTQEMWEIDRHIYKSLVQEVLEGLEKEAEKYQK